MDPSRREEENRKPQKNATKDEDARFPLGQVTTLGMSIPRKHQRSPLTVEHNSNMQVLGADSILFGNGVYVSHGNMAT